MLYDIGMKTNTKFYYIFINIKGALYTADWIKFIQSAVDQDNPEYKGVLDKMLAKHPDWMGYYKAQGYTKSKSIRKICPYNIDSLNRLIDDLKLDYGVNLVITSQKWKDGFDMKTVPALVKNGLNYKELNIDKTDTFAHDTVDGIHQYLSQVGNPDTYVVVDYDDEVCSAFDHSKVIKVDQFHNGLDDKSVDEYLDSLMDEMPEEVASGVSMLDDFNIQYTN